MASVCLLRRNKGRSACLGQARGPGRRRKQDKKAESKRKANFEIGQLRFPQFGSHSVSW
jgi:hypothetical protein